MKRIAIKVASETWLAQQSPVTGKALAAIQRDEQIYVFGEFPDESIASIVVALCKRPGVVGIVIEDVERD